MGPGILMGGGRRLNESKGGIYLFIYELSIYM